MNLADSTRPCQRSLPESGKFLFHDWCEILEASDDSVRSAIKEKAIKVIEFPGCIVIDAALWWASCPAVLRKKPSRANRRPQARRKPGK